MIYVSDKPDQSSSGSFDLEPIMLSAVIVKAARAAYEAYVEIHGKKRTPMGVAVDRYTYRGQLIFSEQPILLPHECFVTMEDISQLDLEES